VPNLVLIASALGIRLHQLDTRSEPAYYWLLWSTLRRAVYSVHDLLPFYVSFTEVCVNIRSRKFEGVCTTDRPPAACPSLELAPQK